MVVNSCFVDCWVMGAHIACVLLIPENGPSNGVNNAVDLIEALISILL